jgi:hypothetical protein
MTPAQIIVALGDTAEVADALGVGLSVVSNMKVRGLPKSRLLAIYALAREKGINEITVDVIVAASHQRKTLTMCEERLEKLRKGVVA